MRYSLFCHLHRSVKAGLWLALCLYVGIVGCQSNTTDTSCPAAMSCPPVVTSPNGVTSTIPPASAYITDFVTQPPMAKLDFLFVVDNSGSMKSIQEKLARNFPTLLDRMLAQNRWDFQVGIISTDMDNPTHRGRLQGSPRILRTTTMSRAVFLDAFQRNIQLGVTGSPYEKPLDAMRAALSPKLLQDPNANQGLLRPGASLAIFFVSDEDDCSHDGTISETELPSKVCSLPRSQLLLDDAGNPITDTKGQAIHGHLEHLTPTATYIQFLRQLQRTVIVAGLIGDPLQASDVRGEPPKSCDASHVCQGAPVCGYVSAAAQRCGGCSTTHVDASPGFRLYDVIKAFGGENWSSICGDDKSLQEAWGNQVGVGMSGFASIVLRQAPDPKHMDVTIDFGDGRILPIVKAQPFSPPKACQQDAECGKVERCGQDSQCYSNGWLVFSSGGAPEYRLVLSGLARLDFAPGPHKKVLKARYLPR